MMIGVGETFAVDASGKTSRESKHAFNMLGGNAYNVDNNNTQRLYSFGTGAGRRPGSSDEHAAVIESETMAFDFEIDDVFSTFYRNATAGTTNTITSWTRNYFFVIRPNPSKMNAYFED